MDFRIEQRNGGYEEWTGSEFRQVQCDSHFAAIATDGSSQCKRGATPEEATAKLRAHMEQRQATAAKRAAEPATAECWECGGPVDRAGVCTRCGERQRDNWLID